MRRIRYYRVRELGKLNWALAVRGWRSWELASRLLRHFLAPSILRHCNGAQETLWILRIVYVLIDPCDSSLFALMFLSMSLPTCCTKLKRQTRLYIALQIKHSFLCLLQLLLANAISRFLWFVALDRASTSLLPRLASFASPATGSRPLKIWAHPRDSALPWIVDLSSVTYVVILADRCSCIGQVLPRTWLCNSIAKKIQRLCNHRLVGRTRCRACRGGAISPTHLLRGSKEVRQNEIQTLQYWIDACEERLAVIVLVELWTAVLLYWLYCIQHQTVRCDCTRSNSRPELRPGYLWQPLTRVECSYTMKCIYASTKHI